MQRQSAPQHGRACTLDEVAAELGLTRQRIQQIETEALVKVRQALEERGVTAEVVVDDPAPDDGRVW